jgi:deazaflavin-dependent oxidoreductase (nitroreductase family)
MAKQYEVTSSVRFVNKMMAGMVRLGIGPKNIYMLTVPGRKTGKLYSTPVSLVIDGNKKWLVSPYGEVGWVRNARAAGEVTLSRRGQSETTAITQLDAEESAPILKQYMNNEEITQPYFDAKPDAPLADFAAEAERHPVFKLG